MSKPLIIYLTVSIVFLLLGAVGAYDLKRIRQLLEERDEN